MDNVGLVNLRRIAVSKKRWRIITTILAPVILLPIAIFWKEKEGKAAYVCLLMMTNWLLELLPLPVTALIPVVFFPLFGIFSTSNISGIYMKDSVVLFIGSLAMAIAFEHSNLHRRIGLKLLVYTGKRTNLLTLGFMTTTAFLSMWIKNATVTAMMISIAEVIIKDLQEHDIRENLAEARSIEDSDISENIFTYNQLESSKNKSTDDVQSNENPVIFQPRNPNMNPNKHFRNNVDNTKSINREKMTPETTDQTSENAQLEIRYTQPEQTRKRRRRKKTIRKRVKRHTKKSTRQFEEVLRLRTTEEYKKMKRVLYLGIAYSSSIGGTATLFGTTPTAEFKRYFQQLYPEATEITFGNWILYNFPTAVICIFFAWGYFVYFLIEERKIEKIENEQIKKEMKLRYSELGRITFHEVAFSVAFSTLVLLLVVRSPQINEGRISVFDNKIEIHSATTTTAMFILLFVIPTNPCNYKECSALLNWKMLAYNELWEIIILIGGSFAMAKGAKESGLNDWIVYQLNILKDVSTENIILILTSITLVMTEIFTNTATAQLMLPIVNDMSVDLRINPLYIMIPVTICSSYSFMLPAGTPPNVLAFNAAEMKMNEMIIPGIIMNILCYITQLLMITTLGTSIFSLRTFPNWVNKTQNITFV